MSATLELPVVAPTGSGLLAGGAVLPAAGPADPVAGPGTEPWEVHRRRFGPMRVTDLLAQVHHAGLDGRGGAFMPVELKWRRAMDRTSSLTVVANAAESEPVAAKDGVLLRQRPHLLLDGLLATAAALGAARVVIWLHGDDRSAATVLRQALADRGQTGVEIVAGPVHYLAGESTAIARALSGGVPLPQGRRTEGPRTLVHNVETLARIGLLARGAVVPATRLLTVLDGHRWVVEVDEQLSLRDVWRALGRTEHPGAVLLGGYDGQWAAWSDVAHVPVAEHAMRGAGLSLGAGAVIPLPVGACGVEVTADILRWAASMSARQCGPCLFGLPALADRWSDLSDGSGQIAAMNDDLRSVEGRGACKHPDGAARMAASAATVFGLDLARHATGHPCSPTRTIDLPGVHR
jgi:NADH:ubiquinone oxidoreductase subunit F (NADH-binding)